MSEASLQKKIIKYLDSLPNTWTVKTTATNKNGCPDILVCHAGKFIAIEVKNPNGKGVTSKLQKYRIKEILISGGIAIVVNSLEEVKELF